MRCAQAHKKISEWIDGELGESGLRRLEGHLRGCAACRKVRDDLAALVEEAKALATPAPSDRVWTGIRSGLAASRSRLAADPARRPGSPVRLPGYSPALRLAAAGLAAVILVAGGVYIGRGVLGPKGPAAPDKGRMEFTLAKLAEAETHYRLAIQALDEAVTSQKESLSPGMAELVGQETGAIDALIKTAEDAVRRDPADLKARAYLLDAFRNKVEFLEAAVEIGRRTAPPAPAEAKI
jgi:anti-sigma factor RsiW